MCAFVIAIHEVFSVFTFNSPFGGELWSIRSDYASGDLGWDPLGLKPTSPIELKEMQTRELNNGRTPACFKSPRLDLCRRLPHSCVYPTMRMPCVRGQASR